MRNFLLQKPKPAALLLNLYFHVTLKFVIVITNAWG